MWGGDALSARFAVAAVILAVGLRLRGVPIRPLPGEWLPIVALGAVGYAGESTLFYLSLTHGTAGACIMLFYAYPAVVTAIGLSRNQIRLTIRSLLALASATAGAVTVVAFDGRPRGGRPGGVDVVGSGVRRGGDHRRCRGDRRVTQRRGPRGSAEDSGAQLNSVRADRGARVGRRPGSVASSTAESRTRNA